MDECVEEVKELKSKGVLNPVIINKKEKTKHKIEDFFKKQKDLNSFVQKKSKSKADNTPEEIEDDSESELLLEALNKL